jgi:MOSC domain-containing protein YiiM
MAAAEHQVTIAGDKTRRNVITRGVPLIDLLDRDFVIGNVVMRGIRLFEPCAHLAKVSKISGIFRALENRSGLKAAILSDGVIHTGDAVKLHSLRDAIPAGR